MRDLKRQVMAILTAAVMTLSAAAGTASAQEGQQKEAAKYTGWVTADSGWRYLADGEPYKSGTRKIDGKMCEFSLNGYYIGGYSGWIKNRCYKDGLPFTGWTDNGYINEKKAVYYCVDGYGITGDLPVGDKIYSFGKTGRYTGKSRDAGVIVSCGEKVSADTEKITFTVENIDGKSHGFKIAKSFEYLKDGKWVSCKNGNVSYASLDKELSKKGEKLSFEVSVPDYSRNKFNKGFYRLPVICGGETYYAVFEAAAPVEIESVKEEYVFGNYDGGLAIKPANTIDLKLTVNSAKEELQTDNIRDKIKVKIEHKTANGWTSAEDMGCDIADGKEKNELTVVPCFYSDEGYYRAVIFINGEKYAETFRIRNHAAKAWLDEYDLNGGDITVSFDVGNTSDETIFVETNAMMLYKKCGGKYSIYEGIWETAANENFTGESNIAEKELKPQKHTTVNFDLSRYYDTSKLKAGEYAVRIDGIGFAEFTLTDKPAEKNLPFKDLKAEDVEEIIITDNAWQINQTAVIKQGNEETKITDETNEHDWREITASAPNSDYLNRSIAYLRQFEVTGKYKNYPVHTGGDSSITVVYKDGTKKELFFYVSDAVRTDGGWYRCSKYAETAFMNIVKELAARNLPFNDLDSESFKEIRFEDIDCDKVTTAVLDRKEVYFGDHVYSIINLELLEEFKDFSVPTGGSVFSVTVTYKNGESERIIFYGHDVVLMPDGKAYYCFEWQFNNIYEVFAGLEHSVSYIEPEQADLPEKAEE